MAHDFIITEILDAVRTESDPITALHKMTTGKHAVFNGYAEAALYKAFDAKEFDAGVSGSFGGRTVSKIQAEKGLAKAIELLASYQDPTRADDIKAYLKDTVLPAPDSKKFYIHYS
jgi:hypothetical protein